MSSRIGPLSELLEHRIETIRPFGVRGPLAVLPVASFSWDDVEVNVEHVLLGVRSRAVGDLDVPESKSRREQVDYGFDRAGQFRQPIWWQIENVREVFLWNHERMKRSTWLDIEECEA